MEEFDEYFVCDNIDPRIVQQEINKRRALYRQVTLQYFDEVIRNKNTIEIIKMSGDIINHPNDFYQEELNYALYCRARCYIDFWDYESAIKDLKSLKNIIDTSYKFYKNNKTIDLLISFSEKSRENKRKQIENRRRASNQEPLNLPSFQEFYAKTRPLSQFKQKMFIERCLNNKLQNNFERNENKRKENIELTNY